MRPDARRICEDRQWAAGHVWDRRWGMEGKETFASGVLSVNYTVIKTQVCRCHFSHLAFSLVNVRNVESKSRSYNLVGM